MRSLIVTPGKAGQQGIVLVATIWILAVLALATAAMAKWVEHAIDQSEERWAEIDTGLKHDAMRQRLELLVLMQRYTVSGLTTPASPEAVIDDMGVQSVFELGREIPLDGTPIRLSNAWSIALLDERAKFSLRYFDGNALGRFLQTLGVPLAESRIMTAQLIDYTDSNNKPVLGGAEAPFYLGLGLPSPPNRRIRTVMEVFRIPAWMAWQDRLLENGWIDKTTATAAKININTVLPDVLGPLWGLPLGTMEKFEASRKEHKIISETGLTKALGRFIPRQVSRMDWYRLAGQRLNLRVWSPDATYGHNYLVDFAILLVEGEPHALQRPAKPLQLLWQRRIPRIPKSDSKIDPKTGRLAKPAEIKISFLSSPIVATARP